MHVNDKTDHFKTEHNANSHKSKKATCHISNASELSFKTEINKSPIFSL